MDDSFTIARSLEDSGFVYLWAGGRGTLGITSGKFYFSVKLLRELQLDDAVQSELSSQCGCVVGVSRRDTDVVREPFGPGRWLWCSEGSIMTEREPVNGEAFGVGDEVFVLVELYKQQPGSISFSKRTGSDVRVIIPPAEEPLFPHVMIKNCEIRIDFEGLQHDPDQFPFLEGFLPWKVRFMEEGFCV